MPNCRPGREKRNGVATLAGKRRARLPETESYRGRFLAENCLDRALYAYAQRRVRHEQSCVGCSEPVCSLACLRDVERDRPTLWAKCCATAVR